MKNKTDAIKLLGLTIVTGLAFTACTESDDKAATKKEPVEIMVGEDISLSDSGTLTVEDTSIALPENAEEPMIMEDTITQVEGAFEMMDNPQFTSWAKFGVGTKVVLENSTETQGMTQKATMTQTLTAKEADSITYDVQIKASFGDQEMDMPAQSQTVPAKIPAGTPTRPSEMPGVKIIEEKEETVTIGDRSINTRMTKFEMQGGEDDNTFTSTTTLWESDEVPGMMVRMQSVTVMGGMTTQSTLMLKEIDIK